MTQKKPKELSEKYIKAVEETTAEQEEAKTPWKYFIFYCIIILLIIINYLASSCSFEIGWLKFNGFKDWGGSISLLAMELILLFIYGANHKINHLDTILDKLASTRK